MGNENYQRITTKQSIPTRKYIALFYVWIWICQRFPKLCNWISPYSLVGNPCFSRRQDQTSYLYFQFSSKIWAFFFLNTSHPFLDDGRSFAFPCLGFLQGLYHLIGGSSFRSIGSSFPLIRSQLTQGRELPFRLR